MRRICSRNAAHGRAKWLRADDPEIVEEWKWLGSPVWELNEILCVGNMFKNKLQLVFMKGAAGFYESCRVQRSRQPLQCRTGRQPEASD
jgi:hypothetical protein